MVESQRVAVRTLGMLFPAAIMLAIGLEAAPYATFGGCGNSPNRHFAHCGYACWAFVGTGMVAAMFGASWIGWAGSVRLCLAGLLNACFLAGIGNQLSHNVVTNGSSFFFLMLSLLVWQTCNHLKDEQDQSQPPVPTPYPRNGLSRTRQTHAPN